MMDSVNALISADRIITTGEISEQLRISIGTVDEIKHDDLAFLKDTHWFHHDNAGQE